MTNFAAHILDGTPLLAPGSDGINGVNLANAILLSSWLAVRSICRSTRTCTWPSSTSALPKRASIPPATDAQMEDNII